MTSDGPEARDGVGEPDAFQRLWTPHRVDYIKGEGKPSTSDAVDCPFCRIPAMGDAEGLIVHRGEHAYAVLNLYPYNAGHLLVCPYRHVADYTELDDDETTEVAAITKTAMRVMRDVTNPQGFNLGMNQGAVAGALDGDLEIPVPGEPDGGGHVLGAGDVAAHELDLARIAQRLDLDGQDRVAHGHANAPAATRQRAHRLRPDKARTSEESHDAGGEVSHGEKLQSKSVSAG
jgi:ATP adenylyltransferase